MQRIDVIDSHTGGEPTRLVLAGGPDLGTGPLTESPSADARSSVLCPGGAYDRSPCGTGTSATLACLAADPGDGKP